MSVPILGLWGVLFGLILTGAVVAQTPGKPWPIRVVIVTTFESGNDTGDAPGEFQFWVEREHLDQVLRFPAAAHPLRTNPEHTVLGVVSGTCLPNASATMMALGLDQRFDLSHAYILINGIAGVDPADASVGSAAWARYVVGDVMQEIDVRETPQGWPYGLYPEGAKGPNQPPSREGKNMWALNARLAAWAYQQTKTLKLTDDPAVAAFRATYTGFPNAQKRPFVLLGDDFASDHYWHGERMTQFANDWVKLYTGGKGNFVMTDMEDSGFMNSIERLDKIHKVDMQRVLVLRTASNFSMQAPGSTAYASLSEPYLGGERLGYESAWLVGSTVLHQILQNWDKTHAQIPGE
jgi:purine nucleoside permease